MRTDFKEERKWKIANAYMISKAIMEWHETIDKSSVCIKVREPTFLSSSNMTPNTIEPMITVIEAEKETEEEKEEDTTMMKSDVEMTEQISSNELIPEIKSEEDEEEEDIQNSMSTQIIQEYHTLIQILQPNQTVFTLLEENDDIISLFPELLLYTSPDPDSIGNDPYFDETEYSRIVPFKLSTQRIILSNNKKRNLDGDIKILPRHERYDTTPQLSRKIIFYAKKFHKN
jgi:hypothetical protein